MADDTHCDATPVRGDDASGDDDDGLFDVGEAWTFTCSYAIDQVDIDLAGPTRPRPAADDPQGDTASTRRRHHLTATRLTP